MKDLLVAVPSRGRPASIDRLHKAMQQTCSISTQLVVGLDADDESRYPRLPGVEYEVREGLRYVTAWINELIMPRIDDYTAIAAGIGDDNLPRTYGWDDVVLEALEDVPFCFANDLYPLRTPGTLSTHMFMRPAVVRALGYAGPPSLQHMYVDNAWMYWGNACGCEFLDEVVIEHLHPTAGKAPNDATYINSGARMGPDGIAWDIYQKDQLWTDIDKIKGVLLWSSRPVRRRLRSSRSSLPPGSGTTTCSTGASRPWTCRPTRL